MSNTSRHDTETTVLVVGGGPVGLAAACLLGRFGVDTVLIERRSSVNPHPRARSVNVRTGEIFRQWEFDDGSTVLDRIIAVSLPMPWTNQMIYTETLAGREGGRLRTDTQPIVDGRRLSPAPWLLTSQDQYEPILADYAARFDNVDIRWGCSLEALDGTTAVTSQGSVAAEYVIAADGAGSTARRELGIDMAGRHDLATLVNCHFTADLDHLTAHRPAMLYWTSGPARNVFQKIDRHGRWLCQLGYDPREMDAADFTPEVALDWIRRSIGTDVDIDLHDVIPWTMSATVAESFSIDGVFLAGDAAHQLPPSGGFGMNTGVQDVHNLAWKIAHVHSGWARRELLDTYELERRPVTAFNVEQSLANSLMVGRIRKAIERGGAEAEEVIAASSQYGNFLGMDLGLSYQDGCLIPDGTAPPEVDDPISDYVPYAGPGHRAPEVELDRGGSSLDLFADRYVLLSADAPPLPDPVAHVPSSARELEGFGCQPDGAILVRPDGHVAWRAATSAQHAGLLDALPALFMESETFIESSTPNERGSS